MKELFHLTITSSVILGIVSIISVSSIIINHDADYTRHSSAFQVPWHATLYLKREENNIDYNYDDDDDNMADKLICGATIIHKNLLITAAHCVFDMINHPENLHIAAGNFFRNYKSLIQNKNLVQQAKVKKIYVHCLYIGIENNYKNDIAILQIYESFNFTRFMKPISLDYTSKLKAIEFNGFGRVAGFGLTEYKSLSTILRIIQVPIFKETDCDEIAFRYGKTLENNQFCAGYTNGTSVCNGDSGGGLAMKNNGTWFLRGIVSISINQKSSEDGNKYICDNDLPSIYTEVSNYIDWIKEIIDNVENHNENPECQRDIINEEGVSNTSGSFAKTKTCPAPDQPKNGRWICNNGCTSEYYTPEETIAIDELFDYRNSLENKYPQGSPMPVGSHIDYICDKNYKLDNNDKIYCRENGEWSNIPKCLEIKCDGFNKISTNAICTRNDDFEPCDQGPILPNTEANLTCKPNYYYQDSKKMSNFQLTTCNLNGKWDPEPINCVSGCGKLPSTSQSLVVNAPNAYSNAFRVPWHATLYKKEEKLIKNNNNNEDNKNTEHEFQCGATIIHENLLITAAHCVFNDINHPENLHIAAGNYFRIYNLPFQARDLVQQAKVKKIYVHCSYIGIENNYKNDIAILQIYESFNFTRLLTPICLDYMSKSKAIEFDGLGRVAGFGLTQYENASSVLQSIEVPILKETDCDILRYGRTIQNDQFCAGYTNGTSVCNGDSGGGLAMEKDGIWFLRGIVSKSINQKRSKDGNKYICDNDLPSIYTEVSNYTEWIKEIIDNVENNNEYRDCQRDIINRERCEHINSTSTNITHCKNKENDDISCESILFPGTTAFLSCNKNFHDKNSEMTNYNYYKQLIQCNEERKWVPEPISCIPDGTFLTIEDNQFTSTKKNYFKDVKFQCDARGEPKPKITWYHNDKEISSSSHNKFIQSDGSLIIIDLLLNDTGKYTCRASNEYFTESIQIELNVEPIKYNWISQKHRRANLQNKNLVQFGINKLNHKKFVGRIDTLIGVTKVSRIAEVDLDDKKAFFRRSNYRKQYKLLEIYVNYKWVSTKRGIIPEDAIKVGDRLALGIKPYIGRVKTKDDSYIGQIEPNDSLAYIGPAKFETSPEVQVLILD